MNVFIASGNLGADIDIRHTPNGKTVGSFSLPVKQGYGEYEKTSWVSCKLLGERAEKLAQYLTKGKEVTVQGEFVYEEWEKDGVKHGKPVIIVGSLDLHGGVSRSETGNSQNLARGQAPAHKQSAQPQPNFDNFDDEVLPF